MLTSVDLFMLEHHIPTDRSLVAYATASPKHDLLLARDVITPSQCFPVLVSLHQDT